MMSGWTLVGIPGVEELPRGVRVNKDGTKFVRRYRGLYDTMYGLIPIAKGESGSNVVTLDPDGDDSPYAIMTIDTGETADGADPAKELNVTWTRSGNDIERLIFAHPDLTFDGAAALRKAAKKLDELSGASSKDAATIRNEINLAEANQTTLVRDLFTEIVQGAEAYSISQPVLRRVAILPANYSKKWPTTNEGKQFTLKQLEEWENLPTTRPFEIPTTGAWLKRAATVEQQRDGTWVANNEWWHADRISKRLYPVAIKPTT